MRPHGRMVKEIGSPALSQLREILRTGQSRQARAWLAWSVGLDVGTLLELLPARMPEWNRFYHDIVVRQMPTARRLIAGVPCWNWRRFSIRGSAGGLDEIGMSGDLTAALPLHAMARPGQADSRSPYIQLKAIESLGRFEDAEAVAFCAKLSKPRKDLAGLSSRARESRRRKLGRKPIPATARRFCPTADWSRRIGDRSSGYGPRMSLGPARRYERMVLANRTIGA